MFARARARALALRVPLMDRYLCLLSGGCLYVSEARARARECVTRARLESMSAGNLHNAHSRRTFGH